MIHHDWRAGLKTDEIAKQVHRGDAAANLLLALLLGVFAALALLHWCGWLVE
mgnify:CR=1 FL=1